MKCVYFFIFLGCEGVGVNNLEVSVRVLLVECKVSTWRRTTVFADTLNEKKKNSLPDLWIWMVYQDFLDKGKYLEVLCARFPRYKSHSISRP